MKSLPGGTADNKAIGLLLPVLAILLSLGCLWPSVGNGWVNWDDEQYVLRNPMVQELSRENLAAMWTTPEQLGLYHPLTMLSLAVDEHFHGNDARGFHLTNLLLHLLNVLLVYFLVMRLSKKPLVAFTVAVLFGMHPMHVESVAWISARKDVLYTAFYLLCLLAWLNFRAEGKRKIAWFSLSVLLFAAALLAKASALTLPLALLLIDYLQGRRWSSRVLVEKAPFFLLSIVAWWVAQAGQQSSESMMQVSDYPLHKTFFIGTRNALWYIAEAVWPWKMSAFHPFPFLGEIKIAWWYYLTPLPFLAGLWLLVKYGKRFPWLFFGLLFFLLSIAPFLQILPYGKAITAERYTYVAYIGLFWVLGWGIDRVWNWRMGAGKWLRWAVLGLGGIWLMLLGGRTYQQARIWENGETLWTSVIESYPGHYFAWLSRGKYLVDRNLNQARTDLAKAISLNPNLAESYYELGRVQDLAGEFEPAYLSYTDAIRRDSSLARAWLNRGLVSARHRRDLGSALSDFDRAIAAQPDYALAYLNRALARKGQGDVPGATTDFGKAIELEPWNAVFYRYRGSHYSSLGQFADAIADFSSAAEIEPENGENYFLMARVQAQTEAFDEARKNADRAVQLGFRLPDGFLQAPPSDSSRH